MKKVYTSPSDLAKFRTPHERELESLRSELQKQKELNAELVKVTEELLRPPVGAYLEIDSHARQKIESLIKKSKES